MNAETNAPRVNLAQFRRGPAPRLADRDTAIVAAYKDGQTLENIGERFGISGERVRQVIKRVAGHSLAPEVFIERRRRKNLAVEPRSPLTWVRLINRWLGQIGYFYCSHGKHAVCESERCGGVCKACNTARCRERNHKLHPEWKRRSPQQRENVKRGRWMGQAKPKREGPPLSREECMRRARAVLAAMTSEQRAARSRKASAAQTPEQRSAAAKKAWETRRARRVNSNEVYHG